MSGVKKKEKILEAQFEHLHSIQIGSYILNEDDLKKHFNEDAIVLMKQVFQKEYPITRTSNGMPRVPSRGEDKFLLIDSLQSYFNHLRHKIIEKKHKTGDSVILRQMIDAIQQVRLLIDHFEESDETFPYHMFQDYLNNKEYFKSVGDVKKQMRDFQFTKSQNERVRNLLRQFAKLYLEETRKHEFDVKDPGMFNPRFQEFMSGKDISKIPPILRDLLLLLDGKYSVVAKETEVSDEKEALYDPSKVYDELTRLLDEIDKDVEGTRVEAAAVGGAKPMIYKDKGTKGLDEQVTAVVDHILEKYKQLRDAHKYVIIEKDKEYNMLDEVTTKKILELEADLRAKEEILASKAEENSRLYAQIADLETTIQDLEKDIEEKINLIDTLTQSLAKANGDLAVLKQQLEDAMKENKLEVRELNNEVKDKQNLIDTLTSELAKANGELANLRLKKDEIEKELNELKPQLTKVIAERDTALAEAESLKTQLEAKVNDLSGNSAELERLRADLTASELDLSSARQQIAEDNDNIDALFEENKRKDKALQKKDEEFATLEKEAQKFKKDYNNVVEAVKKIAAEKKTLEKEVERLNDEIQRITGEHQAALDAQNTQLQEQLSALRAELEKKPKEEALAELRTQIADLERKLAELQRKEEEWIAKEESLNAQITEKNATIAGLEEKIRGLESGSTEQLARLQAELEAEKADKQRLIAEHDAKVRQLEEQIASAGKSSSDALQALRNELATEKASHSSDVQEKDAKIQQLENELSILRGTSAASESSLNDLRGQLASAKTEADGLRANLATAKSEYQSLIDGLNKKNEDLQNKLDTALNSQVASSASETSLKEQLAAALASVQDFTKKHSDAEAERARLAEELAGKTEELRLANLSINDLQASSKTLHMRIVTTEALSNAFKKKIEELNQNIKQCEEKDKEIASLRSRINELESELLSQAEAIRKEAADEINKKVGEHDSAIQAKIQELSTLQADLNAAIQERDKYKAADESLKKTIEQLRKDLNSCLDREKLGKIKKAEVPETPVVSGDFDELGLPGTEVSRKMDAFYNQLISGTFTYDLFDKYFNDYQSYKTNVLYNLINSFYGGFKDIWFLKSTPISEDILNKSKSFLKLLERNKLIKYGTLVTPKEFQTYIESDELRKFSKINEIKDILDPLLRLTLENTRSFKEKTKYLQAYEEYNTKKSKIYRGGGAKDSLLNYCYKVADNSLQEFLLETPLQFFSLIQDFERDSKLDIIQSINEEHILKLFIQHHLETYFESKTMKEFYYHAKQLLKEDAFDYAKMFFVLQEIINLINNDDRKIDVVRIKSKEFNSAFDYLNFKLELYEYDFYSVAKKEFPTQKQMNLTFKDSIFIQATNKTEKVYDFNKNLTLTTSDYDFNCDIYYVNSSMVFLFYILSTHFYLQQNNMIDTEEYEIIEDNLEKTVRKLTRLKNKDKKSIEELMKERNMFKLENNE